MEKTIFWIDRMERHSDEYLIRLALFPIVHIKNLDFDLLNRTLSIYHEGGKGSIKKTIEALKLGEREIYSAHIEKQAFFIDANQTSLLWTIMGINLMIFFLELFAGFGARSSSLVASAMYLLGDMMLYAFGLFGFRSTFIHKKRAVHLTAGAYLFISVFCMSYTAWPLHKTGEMPDYSDVILVAVLSMMVNLFCLSLLENSKRRNTANLSFRKLVSSKNMMINLSVILAGVLVHTFQSIIPEILIAIAIYFLVARQVFNIFDLSREKRKNHS